MRRRRGHSPIQPTAAPGRRSRRATRWAGPIPLLAARRHPEAVRAVVLCATSSNWRSPRIRLLWWSMAWLRLWLGIAPYGLWRGGLRLAGMPDTSATT